MAFLTTMPSFLLFRRRGIMAYRAKGVMWVCICMIGLCIDFDHVTLSERVHYLRHNDKLATRPHLVARSSLLIRRNDYLKDPVSSRYTPPHRYTKLSLCESSSVSLPLVCLDRQSFSLPQTPATSPIQSTLPLPSMHGDLELRIGVKE